MKITQKMSLFPHFLGHCSELGLDCKQRFFFRRNCKSKTGTLQFKEGTIQRVLIAITTVQGGDECLPPETLAVKVKKSNKHYNLTMLIYPSPS